MADGSDNFATRFLLNDACFLAKKPLVSAAVTEFEGQLATYKGYGRTALLSLPVSRAPAARHRAPIARKQGVLGAAAGVMGALQALEVLKEAAGLGTGLSGKILIYKALNADFRTVQPGKGPRLCLVRLRTDNHRPFWATVNRPLKQSRATSAAWAGKSITRSSSASAPRAAGPCMKCAVTATARSPWRQELMASEKATGVKVVKETYNDDTGDFLTLKIFEDGHNQMKMAPAQEDAPHALPCFKPEDLYSYHARQTMSRLLTDFLSRNKITITELIHRADMLEKLEATGTLYQHAIQKVAVAQAANTTTPAQQIVKSLNELTTQAFNRVYRDQRKGLFPDPAADQFAELAAQPGGPGRWRLHLQRRAGAAPERRQGLGRKSPDADHRHGKGARG